MVGGADRFETCDGQGWWEGWRIGGRQVMGKGGRVGDRWETGDGQW